ncbi:MAG: hypothetical protein GOV15_00885 [Candidatus Diapherotrites archaeon]|nr:hypothetical protein [Candidatus Diapherotrites archaeon]
MASKKQSELNLTNQEKAGLLLSGVFLTITIIYGLLTWVVLDGQVKIASGETTYLINTPIILTIFYAFITLFSLSLFLRLFTLVPDVNFKKFIKIVYLIPHLMISTDPIGHRLYIASTSLFVGLAVLSVVPLLSSEVFPLYSSMGLLVIGTAFSALAIFNVSRLLKA